MGAAATLSIVWEGYGFDVALLSVAAPAWAVRTTCVCASGRAGVFLGAADEMRRNVSGCGAGPIATTMASSSRSVTGVEWGSRACLGRLAKTLVDFRVADLAAGLLAGSGY